MAYEIQVSATNVVVNAGTTDYSVTVNSPATANFTITNTLNTVSIRTNLTTITQYSNAIELILANFNDFWRGTWNAANEYYRGEFVEYQNSQYFLKELYIDPTIPYSSATPPNEDSSWVLFNWHEAPFAVLTVTNSATFFGPVFANSDLNVGGGIGVGGVLTVNGNASFNGNLSVNGNFTNTGVAAFNTASFSGPATFTTATFNTATIANVNLRNIRGENLYLTGSAVIEDDLFVYDNAVVEGSLQVFNDFSTQGLYVDVNGSLLTFSSNIAEVFTNFRFYRPTRFDDFITVNSTATFNSNVSINNLTLQNATVTNRLTVNEKFIYNGLEYPKDRGIFGQVLFTNGTNKADWVNLGELVFWSLSSDLFTNGFDIYTNSLSQDLNIGVSTSSAMTNSPAYIKLQAEGRIDIDANNDLWIRGGGGSIRMLGGKTSIDKLKVTSAGIEFGDGTVQTTANAGGGVTSITAGTGTVVNTSTGAVTIWTAGGGAAKTFAAGVGLEVSDINNVVRYTLKAASTGSTALGGITVGDNLVIDPFGRLSAVASSTAGRISLQEDMLTNGNAIRFNTTGSGPRIIVASDIDIDTGGSSLTLRSNGETILRSKFNGIETSALGMNASTIVLSTPTTVAGRNANNSQLNVQRIYNYAGSSAPFFPAGVQYPDNTIQFTAYQPDQGLL